MDDRRGDWAHGVDENLAALNSGQRSQDEKLKHLEEGQEDLDNTLHGDTDSGLIGRIEDLETEVARLNAVIFQDASGKKGLHHDILMVLEGREDRRLGWGNITKIVVALIMAGLVGRFYGDLVKAVMPKPKPPVERKRPHRRVIIREIPPDPPEEEQEQ